MCSNRYRIHAKMQLIRKKHQLVDQATIYPYLLDFSWIFKYQQFIKPPKFSVSPKSFQNELELQLSKHINLVTYLHDFKQLLICSFKLTTNTKNIDHSGIQFKLDLIQINHKFNKYIHLLKLFLQQVELEFKKQIMIYIEWFYNK